MDPAWALRQIAFQLERSGAPTYRVRAFRRAAEVVAGLGPGELAGRVRAGTLRQLCRKSRKSSRARMSGTSWRAMADAAGEEREAYEQSLRLTWEHEDDFDPLLSEIAAARDVMLRAEARMRLLIAYGREFTRPRPYRLEDLARASGMSISGVRTPTPRTRSPR